MKYRAELARNEIAYRWARAARRLWHGDHSNGDVEKLRRAIDRYWEPLQYDGDLDEIIRIAILEAHREMHGGRDTR